MYEQSDLALIGSRIKAVRTGKGMSQGICVTAVDQQHRTRKNENAARDFR